MVRGVTQNTFQNLQLNEGAFLTSPYAGTLTDSQILSATRGGATINITPVYRTRNIDGVPANTKEARTVDSVTVTASFVALEANEDLITKACGVADYDSTTGKITLRHKVKTTDFADLYWIGDISDGRKVQIKFANALNTSGLSLTTAQNDEGGLSMTFEGNYSVADLDTPPVEITFIEA